MSDFKLIAEPGKQELTYSYTLNASADRVFKAFTDPEALPQWWGPRILTTTVEKMEARAGGEWRFVQKDPQGNTFAFHGVYHTVEPRYVVQTFEFEGVPGHVIMETMRLEEVDGKTIIKGQSVFQSVADRDGMVQSGMEGGMVDSMERMEELLAKG